MKSRVIKVDQLARVEGEGALYIKIRDGQVADVKLRIYEPPRFFEAFLRGRDHTEAPDITARICGICPVAYQMSSVHAMEDALGITVGGQLRALRRLLYCGEWLESHLLHIYMLHAPDFLGYEDALLLAKDKPELVKMALEAKKIGNQIVSVVGGREIHPVNVRVGGFYRVPAKRELAALRDPLQWTRDAALETVKVVAGFEFPEFEVDYDFVSLRHPEEYPFNEGRVVSSRGLDIPVREYEFHFEERHMEHANALHSYQKGVGAYHVGPLARFNLNFDRLSPLAQQAAREAGCVPPVRNPFKSIIVRAVESVYAADEALRIIAAYEPPDEPAVKYIPRGGIGFGASEAPRGMLYHRYRLGDDGLIRDAKIVPPTSQNQPTIEDDLRRFVAANLSMPREELTWKCEQAVRNYDPCISCATHFLRLEITGDPA
ncbi:MAG: Ni/Fe hydrogenase subunit alpha [Bacteroidota bacterium]